MNTEQKKQHEVKDNRNDRHDAHEDEYRTIPSHRKSGGGPVIQHTEDKNNQQEQVQQTQAIERYGIKKSAY